MDATRFPLREPPPRLWLAASLAVLFALLTAGAGYLVYTGMTPALLFLPLAFFALPAVNTGSALLRMRRAKPMELVVDEAGVHVPAIAGSAACTVPLGELGIAASLKPGLVVAGERAVCVVPARAFVGATPDDAANAILAVLVTGHRAYVEARNESARLAQRKKTPAVWSVAGVIAALFAFSVWRGGFASADGLVLLGAAKRDLVLDGQVWRIGTGPLLHGGLLHLALNGSGLLSVGAVLERWLGRSRFLVILLGSALFGALVSVTVREGASVGISGGLFGLLGALLVSTVRYRKAPAMGPRIALRSWIILLVTNGAISLMPIVDGAAHGAGLVAGAALAMVLIPRVTAPDPPQRTGAVVGNRAALVAAVVLVAIFAASTLAMVVRSFTT